LSIRLDYLDWLVARRAGDDLENQIPADLSHDVNNKVPVFLPPDIEAKGPTRPSKAVPPPASPSVLPSVSSSEARHIRFPKPRIHWLEPPSHNCDVRWPLRHLRNDIFNSSTYLDSLIQPRLVFTSLPERHRKPRFPLGTWIIKRLPIA
jgi:hypothetical protein